MFSWYKYLIINFFSFSHLGFWSGNFFLIAPDHCLFLSFPRLSGTGMTSRTLCEDILTNVSDIWFHLDSLLVFVSTTVLKDAKLQ